MPPAYPYPYGGEIITYDTKVILRLLARQVAKSDSLEEAYDAIAVAAGVEGVKVPGYDEERKRIEELGSNKEREKEAEMDEEDVVWVKSRLFGEPKG